VLGFSRALGETMAVMMVVGSVPRMPQSVFDPAYPLTALIANGYSEMMSIPPYDSALMLAALLLLGVVLVFNLLARAFLRQMQHHPSESGSHGLPDLLNPPPAARPGGERR
jgi:phosphate transport system permease protein